MRVTKVIARAHEEHWRKHHETPDPERCLATGTFTLSALDVLQFAPIGKACWAIDTFRARGSGSCRKLGSRLVAVREGRPR